MQYTAHSCESSLLAEFGATKLSIVVSATCLA
jgi:hypothetical protein